MFVLNKVPPEESMPNQFEWAGLYDSTTFKPACPAVVLGIEKALLDPATAILRFLVDHQGTIGTALELFVERGLRANCPKDFVVPCSDLTGEKDSTLVWKLSFVRRQSRDSPAAVLENIMDGTLIICCPGHSVVDMVLYSGGAVYLIQVSMLAYIDHSTKIENLELSLVPGSTESVGFFYTSRAPAGWSVPLFNGVFTKNVQEKMKYVYITPDTTSHRVGATSKMRHVLRIGGNQLQYLC